MFLTTVIDHDKTELKFKRVSASQHYWGFRDLGEEQVPGRLHLRAPADSADGRALWRFRSKSTRRLQLHHCTSPGELKPACTTSILLVLGTQPPTPRASETLPRLSSRKESISICLYDLIHGLLLYFSFALRSRLPVALCAAWKLYRRPAPPDSYVTQTSHRIATRSARFTQNNLHTSTCCRITLSSVVFYCERSFIRRNQIAVTGNRRFARCSSSLAKSTTPNQTSSSHHVEPGRRKRLCDHH